MGTDGAGTGTRRGARPATPLLVAFAGGRSGPWRIESIEGVSGEPLQAAARLSVVEGAAAARAGDGAAWVLRGVTAQLTATQAGPATSDKAIQTGYPGGHAMQSTA
jgi:hypothetical protein